MIGEIVLFKLASGAQRPALVLCTTIRGDEAVTHDLMVALHPNDKRDRANVVPTGDGIRHLFTFENETTGVAEGVECGDGIGQWQFRE